MSLMTPQQLPKTRELKKATSTNPDRPLDHHRRTTTSSTWKSVIETELPITYTGSWTPTNHQRCACKVHPLTTTCLLRASQRTTTTST